MSNSKELNPSDVLKTYKTGYRIKFPWEEILSEDFGRWMGIFDKATNCSQPMVMSALLPIIATLCGPNTVIQNSRGSFKTSLNTYVIIVCDPSGGKSNTFSRILKPILQYYKETTGHDLNLEALTIPGVQSHQATTKGYGIITSDEGSRILTPIRQRNAKGEPDVAFLCKMWGGVGDSSTLMGGHRGCDKTSMSMWLAIQPTPLLEALPSFKKADGFLERFIFTVCKPYFVHPDIHDHFFELLKQENMQNFTNLLIEIFDRHKQGRIYKLAAEANAEFREMNVSYYNCINSKYTNYSEQSDDDDAEESSISEFFNSKQIFHILKIATIFHILFHLADCIIRGEETSDPPLDVPLVALERATSYYHTVAKQRYQSVESVSFIDKASKQRLQQPISLSDRVLRAICCTHGPATTLRDIANRIKGLNNDEIRPELPALVAKGFGSLRKGSRNSITFFKPHPTMVKEKDVNVLGMSYDTYTANFMMVQQMPQPMIDICINHHPHHEMLLDILSQYSDDSD